MATVYLRGRMYYSKFLIGGRQIRMPLDKDKREAQIKMGKLMERMGSESRGEPSKNISWEDFKTKYLTYCRGSKKESTNKSDRASINSFERSCRPQSLAEITPEILERFKGIRTAAKKGTPTINRELTALKAMFHKAGAWGYMEKHDWASVKLFKQARRKLYYHSPVELGRLLAVCHGVWKTICLLGSRAGLRREEIYMLTWEDIDFERGRIHVVGKEGWQPKDYEQRFIPLSPDLGAHLKSLMKRGVTRKWVIADGSGTKPSLAVMSAYFQKLARKVKLKGSLHILRHTFASHLVQNGESLKRVKDWLGHSDMKTTEIYAHLAPSDFESQAIHLPPIPCA